MEFVNQEAQIRAEDEGFTVRHMGSTFPPDKVLIPNNPLALCLSILPEGRYHDAIICGTRDNEKETITITGLSL